MTLEKLIAAFRLAAKDEKAPYLWSDEAVTGWLNESVAEAAIRARLLHESENPAVCSIDVTAGTSVYPLHKSLYEITSIGFKAATEATRTPLYLISIEAMDRKDPEWRDRTGTPKYAIQTDTTIRLSPTPDADGAVLIEAYRLPLKDLADDADEPEIHTAHHIHLIDWALHKAFSIPDSEAFDASRAGMSLDGFTGYFGERPDSDLRRTTRADETQTVKAFLP